MWSVYIDRHQADRSFRFADLLRRQDEVLSRIRPLHESALVFAELPPTLTLGARQVHQADPARLSEFQELGIEVVSGERGGNETWHGPGQWVGFVLTSLESFTGDSKGVRLAVFKILDLLLPVVQEFIPEARIEEGARLGIWSNRGKVVSIGIKIREGYTTSGFAINCIPNERAFAGINPCGIAQAKPDFLFRDFSDQSEVEKNFQRIPERILNCFSQKK